MAKAGDETANTATVEEEEEEKKEEEEEDPKSSLFPLFPLSDSSSSHLKTTSKDPQWLCNSSFTFDVSSIQTPISSSHHIDEDAHETPPSEPPAYDLLDSSPSDRDSKGRTETRKKRKKKRTRSREEDQGLREVSRKSGVHSWAGSDTKPDKDYYIDTRGDYDNLVYGCLYRYAFFFFFFLREMLTRV